MGWFGVGLGMSEITHEQYPELLREFSAHWGFVDGALAPGAGVVVLAGVDRGAFEVMAEGLRVKRRGRG